MPISLSTGNTKLVKTNGEVYKILGFGIPADYHHAPSGVHTCPGASACKAVCYAKQGRYLMPNVSTAKHVNLMASLNDTFTDDMINLLKHRPSYNVVRIHDAGDFYNQDYYNKWCRIAEAFTGDIIFYAYTKALHLDLFTNKPGNLKIIQSLGGKYDSLVDLSKPHSRIFSTHEARASAGYVDGNINDIPAIEGITNIGLVYHGRRKLTIAQQDYFS